MDRPVQAPDGMYIARGEMRVGCRPENSSTAADYGSRSLRLLANDGVTHSASLRFNIGDIDHPSAV
jgi:hypothetical protein